MVSLKGSLVELKSGKYIFVQLVLVIFFRTIICFLTISFKHLPQIPHLLEQLLILSKPFHLCLPWSRILPIFCLGQTLKSLWENYNGQIFSFAWPSLLHIFLLILIFSLFHPCSLKAPVPLQSNLVPLCSFIKQEKFACSWSSHLFVIPVPSTSSGF